MNDVVQAAWGLSYLGAILIQRFKISLLSNNTSKNICNLKFI